MSKNAPATPAAPPADPTATPPADPPATLDGLEASPAPPARPEAPTLTVRNESKAPHYVCNTLILPGKEAQIEAALLVAAYPGAKRQKLLSASGMKVSAGKKSETK